MKNNSIRFVLALLTLVIGASAEELLPKFLGVGFPVLLAAVPFFSLKRPAMLPVLYALAAGATEDALSGLPLLTSASLFLVLTALSRWTHLPSLVAVFSYPVYQVWLCLWCSDLQGSIFTRCLLAIPVGAFAFAVVTAILLTVERRAGADEAG